LEAAVPASADRTGAETRNAIIEAAARSFRAKGYEVATLGEIAAELNITRSAVLHHFASKQALLEEVVAPFITSLDAMLDRREAAGRITPRGRRPLLIELVDVVCDHPDVSAIMAFDVAVRHQLPPTLQIEERATRFAQIVTLTVDDPHGYTRALAAIGAILRPVYVPPGLIDLNAPETRQVLVDAAMAVFSTAPTPPA
jgi:AcrR family transcriptional regulator